MSARGLTIAAAWTLALVVGRARAEEARWYEQVKVGGFVDGYASLNFATPKTGFGKEQNRFRAFDTANGMQLHWVGLDGTIEPSPVGAGVSLRFGPSAAVYTGSPDNDLGLTNLKQAYISYKPGGPAGTLQLVFGKWDTPYGGESADSQLNVTYTRSMLGFFAQPNFHTGLRADWQPNEVFLLKISAINGWNNAVDNNLGKTFGLQATYKPSDAFLVAIGWLGGPEQPDHVTVGCEAGQAFDGRSRECVASPSAPASETVVDWGGANKRWRHLVDAMVDWYPGKRWRLLFNASWGTEEVRSFDTGVTEQKSWWGVDLTVRAKVTDAGFVGVRASHMTDPHGFMVGTDVDTRVTSGTLTLGWTPNPNLMVKLEPRVDVGNQPFFARGIGELSRVQWTTTLGVVATTN